jgi:plastocyanin
MALLDVRPFSQLSILLGLFACNAAMPCAHADGSVEGSVVIEPMKPATGPGYRVQTKNPVQPPDPQVAVVFLERDEGSYPKARVEPVVRIAQSGYQFRPTVTAVQTGSRVTFPNQDDEFHNVFSYSRSKRFDLGRFRKDEKSPLVTFDRPGLVKIYCEIHKHMRHLLLVLDTPWFTTSDAQGRFVLNNVPAGEYWLKAFLPSEKILQTRVRVADGKMTTVNLTH